MNPAYKQVKVIGMNGQLSIGKRFAGKTVQVDQIDKTTLVIKIGNFIPDSEKWLYQGENLAKLEKALEWTEKTIPSDNFDQFVEGMKE